MKKRLFLSLSVTLMVSFKAMADSSGNCGTGCTYTLDNNGLLTVTGTGNNASISGSKFYGNTQIKDIVIKGSITSIGTDAFHSISNLETIDMSKSQIKTIGQGAFMDSGINTLKSLEFSPTLETIQYAGFKNTGKSSTSFTSVSFPDSLKTIGNQGFALQQYIEHAKLPNQLETVEYAGLTGLRRVESLVIPDTLKADKIDTVTSFWGLSLYTEIENPKIYCSAQNEATCQAIITSSGSSKLSYKLYTKNGDFYEVDGIKYASLADMEIGREYHSSKRIYTVEEAEKALGKNNRNTFSIRYR